MIDKATLKRILHQAVKEEGVIGWAGMCGCFAVAVNEVLFDNQATYVVACNQALYAMKDFLVGHVVVSYTFPGDTTPTYVDAWMGLDAELEDIKAWGMVDHTDPDYSQHFSPTERWDEETANSVLVFPIHPVELSDSPILYLPMNKLDEYKAVFKKLLQKGNCHE